MKTCFNQADHVWGGGAVTGPTSAAVVLQLLTIWFKLLELFILSAILPQTPRLPLKYTR